MSFEFLPDWLKAVIGGAVILFIGIAGFRATSQKANKGNSNNNSNNSNSN